MVFKKKYTIAIVFSVLLAIWLLYFPSETKGESQITYQLSDSNQNDHVQSFGGAVPIIDGNVVIERVLDTIVIQGDIEQIRLAAKTKTGNKTKIEAIGGVQVRLEDLSLEPIVEFEYKNHFYKLEIILVHQRRAIGVGYSLNEIKTPTMDLKPMSSFEKINLLDN